uniref:Uncharacterized protein n=1 Tax=Opuntia streptacantha TaxID=393608 RepID=A0A7C9A4P0_OPUST
MWKNQKALVLARRNQMRCLKLNAQFLKMGVVWRSLSQKLKKLAVTSPVTWQRILWRKIFRVQVYQQNPGGCMTLGQSLVIYFRILVAKGSDKKSQMHFIRGRLMPFLEGTLDLLKSSIIQWKKTTGIAQKQIHVWQG